MLAPSSVNTYHLTNGELRGANVIITNFLWLGGDLNAENAASNTVTIPPGGTLTLAGATAERLSGYTGGQGRRLVHQGTGTWSGAGIAGFHGAQFLNQGHLTLTSDAGLAYGGGTGAPVFHNQGTFSKTDGAGVAAFSSTLFTNAGTLNIARGGITIGGVFHQIAGNANLGTNFTAHSDVRIDAGSFTGRGSVAGPFYNNGVSRAGSPLGLMTGTSWTNSATGTIRFEIGGTNPGTNFDQFRLSGPAQIGGSADLALANGFVPSPGNTFTTVLATVRSGTFSNLTFSGGYQFSALYTPTSVVFRAENALPTVALVSPGGHTQLVCNPFLLQATASDVGGFITNLAILQGGSVIASSSVSPVTTRVESDFPGPLEFVARAMDDQGGTSSVTQTLNLVTLPLNVLTLGGIRTNGFKICMLGQTGSNYAVLATTDIDLPEPQWTALGLMEHTNGIWRFFDPSTMTNRARRFYRAAQTP